MPATGWMRKWSAARAQDRHDAASIRAAARGESLEQLLDAAVQELLATAGADRAGLWLAEERPRELCRGRIADSVPGPLPDRWKHLDVSTPLLRAARESSEPLRVESDSEQTLPQLGPQVGMSGAIWIPLRLRDRTLGLAMAGYVRAHAASRLDLDALRTYGERIALSIAHCRETRQRELEAEESRALVRLSRAILCDV
jgi:GAF domain-containing protein